MPFSNFAADEIKYTARPWQRREFIRCTINTEIPATCLLSPFRFGGAYIAPVAPPILFLSMISIRRGLMVETRNHSGFKLMFASGRPCQNDRIGADVSLIYCFVAMYKIS